LRIGGTEQVIKNLIEGSDTRLFEMSIFCIEEPIGPFGKLLLAKGISISSTQRREGFDLKLIKTIRQHLIEHEIDVLHSHQYTPWVYGTLAALGTKTKIILTEHGRFYPDQSSWKRALANPLLSLATNKITAISKATKQALVDYEHLPEEKIQVIYNGITPLNKNSSCVTDIRSKIKISENTQIIGTIARLDPIKNQSMMLLAFQAVLKSYPDTILLIVGDGEEKSNLKKLAKELEVTNKVIFTGYITEPSSYLEAMDIFLLSSLSEGTSMTLLEALSLGKPCVVTDAGGNPEIITHEINGAVTPNNDTAAFAHAIIDLLSNDRKYQRLASASSDTFNEKFNIKFMMKEYQSIYQAL